MITRRLLGSCARFLIYQMVVLTCAGWLLVSSISSVSALPASCDFSQAISADVRLVDGRGGSQFTVPVNNQMRQAFNDLHGFGLWQDGPNGSYGTFTTPGDIKTIAWITLTTTDGESRWLWIAESPSTPGHAYAWVFTSLRATTDSHGEHYGTHEMCATVDVPFDRIQALLAVPNEPVGVVQANTG